MSPFCPHPRHLAREFQPMMRIPTVAALIGSLAFALGVGASSRPSSPNDWQVANLVRTVELGGSVHTQMDVHTIRRPAGAPEPAESDSPTNYFFALFQRDASILSAIECTAKFGAGVKPSQRAVLPVQDEGAWDEFLESYLASSNVSAATRPHLFSVKVPAAFQRRAREDITEIPDVTLTITSTLLPSPEPLPRTVGQKESQYLVWTGDTEPLSVYPVDKARTKVKAPHPKIVSYETTPPLPSDLVTKSGAIVTFGPYERLSALNPSKPVKVAQAKVHYGLDAPVVSVIQALRKVQVSHWRNRLSFEDKLWLKNAGAMLKGHFSRIEHQMSNFMKVDTSHVLTHLVMHLPPGADDAWFVDDSGNVSTSHFRTSSPSPKDIGTPPHLLPTSRASMLDVRPRYPLLGGWNYSFSIGWGVHLADGWGQSMGASRYQVKIPFVTPLPDIAIQEATARIVLPEGASDIEIQAPFTIDAQTQERDWSFLDTVGSPVVILTKFKCSDRHGGLVSITYTLSALDHWRKVIVGTVLLIAGIVTTSLLSKIDLRIK